MKARLSNSVRPGETDACGVRQPSAALSCASPTGQALSFLAPLVVMSISLTAMRAELADSKMNELTPKLPPPATATIDFDSQIRPILEDRCFRCHGPEKPKSGFRLDTRETALKGGKEGVDIIPGKSAESPLVYYIARLVEDMEMPPPDRGDPLTPEQVGTFRAWINQGANWGSATNGQPKVRFSVTPQVQFFSVQGNEAKFREQTGIREGWGGGAQSIYYEQPLKDGKFIFDAKIYDNPDQFRLKLYSDKRDFGFVDAGFEQYRDYYDDTGGYHPAVAGSPFKLDRDLHIDTGRAWANFGLTLPNWPRMVFGYEYQYRQGSEATLQWGDAGTIEPYSIPPNYLGGPAVTDAKKIYPAWRSIDEGVHIIKFDLNHEIAGVNVDNSFRTELYSDNTQRENVEFYNALTSSKDKYVDVNQSDSHFQASDALRLEKQLLSWLYLSGGYYYSKFDGDFSFAQQTVSPVGSFSPDDKFYRADRIIFNQDAHVFNANAQLGPWDGFNLFGGVQNEWMTQQGHGPVNMDEGIPGSIVSAPGSVNGDIDRVTTEEHLGARYTKIPYTVLFVEGRLQQESIDQFEDAIGGAHQLLRDTDASSDYKEARTGFTFSPWTRASLTAQYKRRDKDSYYNHLLDQQASGTASPGYSAFIRSRAILSDEVEIKLTLRPANWIKTTLSWQQIASDYTTITDPLITPAFYFGGVLLQPQTEVTPGGAVFAGNYDAHIYSANVAVTPWSRLQLSSTFSWRRSRTTTEVRWSPAVVPYEGDVYSSLSSATFTLNAKTHLNASYNYSWTDYGQSNYATGLPLGLVYDWHMVSLGLTRQIKKNITANLQYRFYSYDEQNTGGMNNYIAHGVIASLRMIID